MRISAGHQHGLDTFHQFLGVGFPLVVATTARGQVLEERVVHRKGGTLTDIRPDADDV